jgi:hypothetical protein
MFKTRDIPIVVKKTLKIELLSLEPGIIICDFIQFDLSKSEGRSAMRTYQAYMQMYGCDMDYALLHNNPYDIYTYCGGETTDINKNNYLNPGDWFRYEHQLDLRKEEELKRLRNTAANFIT